MSGFLSEYQMGTRNARVYVTSTGTFGVVTFESESDYNGFETFGNETEAENYAEDWVHGIISI